MKIIRTDLLNDLVEEYKEYKLDDESFQLFVERTMDDEKHLTIDMLELMEWLWVNDYIKLPKTESCDSIVKAIHFYDKEVEQ